MVNVEEYMKLPGRYCTLPEASLKELFKLAQQYQALVYAGVQDYRVYDQAKAKFPSMDDIDKWVKTFSVITEIE